LPNWLYEIKPEFAVIIMMAFVETVSLLGLFLARRFLIGRLHGANDAVSGTVQAIGVFYGITVGLIAVAVWNTNSAASQLVSKEATSIAALHRDIGGYPQPIRDELRAKLRDYTMFIIEEAWPAQRAGRGQLLDGGVKIMDDFQIRLYGFEPSGSGQAALHQETLRAYHNLIENRRLRIDAVNGGLSGVMWVVIWLGAVISIGVAYFYDIADPKLHAILVGLMAGFLGLLLFMIVINDRPFFGYHAVSSDPYKLILERLIDLAK
jgi:hypothetical protein